MFRELQRKNKELSSEKCIEILGNLGFELLGKNDLTAKFRVPSFRRNLYTCSQ